MVHGMTLDDAVDLLEFQNFSSLQFISKVKSFHLFFLISKLFKFTVHIVLTAFYIKMIVISKLFKFIVHYVKKCQVIENDTFQNFSSL